MQSTATANGHVGQIDSEKPGKPVKWKKLAVKQLQSGKGMKVKKLVKRVLIAAGKADSKAFEEEFLTKLTNSSQFQIQDGIVRLADKE